MTETLAPALPHVVEALIRRVLEKACERRLSLITAESCTGGLLASVLTDVEGMAHAFDRGFVVYSNRSKQEMLGVPAPLLEDPGPVSEPVARAMAEGGLARASGDIALAVTGYAGPAGPGEPQGLVHFACAARGRATRHRCEDFGPVDRREGRLASLRVALEMIDQALGDWAPVKASGPRGG
ncbi:MAG: CinA family protein [Caulobacteraceae bacterium]|nr:CinA family protein [Caulobacteraceae bacterium]